MVRGDHSFSWECWSGSALRGRACRLGRCRLTVNAFEQVAEPRPCGSFAPVVLDAVDDHTKVRRLD